MFKKISPKRYLSTIMAFGSLCGVLYLVVELRSIKTKVNRIDDQLSNTSIPLEDVDPLMRLDDPNSAPKSQMGAQTPKNVTSPKNTEPKSPGTEAAPINTLDQ